jgi:hypothetical protein
LIHSVYQLDPSLESASGWVRHIDATYGISLALPEKPISNTPYVSSSPHTVLIFDAPLPDTAHLSVYFDPTLTQQNSFGATNGCSVPKQSRVRKATIANSRR